jgi:hypothetical protein
VAERVDTQFALKKAQEMEIERNDRNYWEQIESYISRHSNTLFSPQHMSRLR